MRNTCIFFLMAALMLAGCRKEELIYVPEQVELAQPEYTSVERMFVLCEGNMGTNKATLDYYDYTEGRYYRDAFPHFNPGTVREMGDVGNDLGIYGSKLYAVINCSNKIDVLNKHTLKKVGQIDIPNCRFIKFHDGYAYVTSYAGPVEIDPDYTQRGYVAKVDTTTLQVVDRCLVGFQPDELEIVNGKIYVANSGGYMVPNYENTISVIDLNTFTEERRIPIAINLKSVCCDKRGILWITSRGDYYDTSSRLYAYDIIHDRMVKEFDCRVSSLWMDGDSIYVAAVEWSYITAQNTKSFAIINTATMQQVTSQFITDGTDADITIPYGVAVHPITKDIYVTDAKDYVSPGRLYCFGPDGKKKWDVRTGDIPGHFAFLGKETSE